MGFNERVLSPAFPPRSIRTILLSFFGTCIFFSFYTLSHIPSDGYRRYYDRFATYFEQGVYNNTLYQNGTEAAVHPHYNFSQPCQGFPSMDDIMVVMKTGATEAFEKMPTQLLTSLQCIPDFLLFSDLVRNIGPLSFSRTNFLGTTNWQISHLQRLGQCAGHLDQRS